MAKHELAPPVEAIAKKLIASHHTNLHGLDIRYVFKEKAGKKMGREVHGTATVKKGVPAMLALGWDHDEGAQYGIVTIAKDIWEKATPEYQEYLVDHELSHLDAEYDEKTGNRVMFTVPHDIEEFGAVIRRHGLQDDTSRFLEAVGEEQLRLFVDTL